MTLLFNFLLPQRANCAVLISDTLWEGEITISEDILVPEGKILTIKPGTVVRIIASESTKTDPEYLSPLTEITVRGELRSEGIKEAPVLFMAQKGAERQWAGIILDGGKAVLTNTTVQNADTGLELIKGSLDVKDSVLKGNRYGLVVQGGSTASLESTVIKENDYGIFLLNGARLRSKNNIVEGNRKRNNFHSEKNNVPFPAKEYKPQKTEKYSSYGDEALTGTTVWEGRIEVNGTVRVPENARLFILPGTQVEFRKKDTNGDGIGENGILVQGAIVAKGTLKKPIIFKSAEKQARMGDWDSVNIMNSDKGQNLFEYCQIEDAYRGLHFHFSNVAVNASVLKNNYRGIQFQESIVEITGTYIYSNKSGLQARDSDITLSGNYIYGNYAGANLFRDRVVSADNRILNNSGDGLIIREGTFLVQQNLIEGNRDGLRAADSVQGEFSRNIISRNSESGLSLKNTNNIEVAGNAIQDNGLTGINILNSAADIKNNLISGNGDKGIGVISFQGAITKNNIFGNGQYNLGTESERDISAPMNWWGDGDIEKSIYDKKDDPSRGSVQYLPREEKPVVFFWPLKAIETDTRWEGFIGIENTVTVEPGAELRILPNTKVFFSKNSGLTVKGRITAKGEKNARISFISLQGEEAGEWDEIMLDHATGSVFSNSSFENATWALHSHFTDLRIENCAFMNNYGGIRFASGPLQVIRSVFKNNDIALRAYRGNAIISENTITENRIGIFVREKGGGLKIRKNNIYANGDYNIRLGDFNNEDVDARENWWGETAPDETIFDAKQEPGIGRVHFTPYAHKPFATDKAALESGAEMRSGDAGVEKK